ncbi:MAG: phenylacetic acid degradation PaaB family protein [Haloferacaceae archaeon]
MKTTRYAVFTRQQPGDDLILAGSVNAPNERLARINAREMYDEEDWAQMLIVEEDELIDVQAIESATTGEVPA